MNPLNHLNTLELLNKIKEFKKIDLKHATLNEINIKILNTLPYIPIKQKIIPEGTFLYRVRKLDYELLNIPKTFQDIWHPPAGLVTTDGRVNLKGNPMLYTATDQLTPLYECGIKENDAYAIIQYVVKPHKKIIGYTVGIEENDNVGLNETGKINSGIIEDFIVSEFTKPVGVGTEYLYKISNIIAQNFMDMPFCDAYMYPSVANHNKGYNVAIKPQSAIENIEFSCVLICIHHGFDFNNRYLYEVKHKANILKHDNLIYSF